MTWPEVYRLIGTSPDQLNCTVTSAVPELVWQEHAQAQYDRIVARYDADPIKVSRPARVYAACGTDGCTNPYHLRPARDLSDPVHEITRHDFQQYLTQAPPIMASLSDLKKSISEMSDEELLERHMAIRANRRSGGATDKVKTPKGVKKAKSPEALLAGMTDAQREALLKELLG